MGSNLNDWTNIRGNNNTTYEDGTGVSPTTFAPYSVPSGVTQFAPANLQSNSGFQVAPVNNTTTQTTTPPPVYNSVTGGNAKAYQNLGGWNPFQYATDATTQGLASYFGGTPTKTAQVNGGPFGIPQQNSIDFGNGFVSNAGLAQQLIDTYGLDYAKRMLGDQAKVASGSSLGIGTDPSLMNYDAALTKPMTANNVSPFTGLSTNQATTLGMTPQSGVNPTITPTVNNSGNNNGNPANSYIQNLFGGGASSNNFLTSLLSMFGNLGSSSNNSNNMGGTSLASLLSLLGMNDNSQYTQPRYNLFY